MNPIFQKIEDRLTGMRRADYWASQPAVLDYAVEETGRIREHQQQSEHVLQLRLAVTYWANPAQERDARRATEHVLLHALYADILQPLAALRRACTSGTREEALALCGEIESKALGR